MSHIEPNIIDPAKGPPMPPDSLPGENGPNGDPGGDDAIREPDVRIPPIEPDPEEGTDVPSDIERATPSS